MHQLAQTQVLIQHISSTLGSFLFHHVKQDPDVTCIELIAVSTCQARILLYWMKVKTVPLEVQSPFRVVEPSHQKVVQNFEI